MTLLQYITYSVLVIVALFHIIGLPPVTYWFRCELCDKCMGKGYVKR